MSDPTGLGPMDLTDPHLLDAALFDLSRALAMPAGDLGGPDPAMRARLRIVAGDRSSESRGWRRQYLPGLGRPLRRGLVLALLALVVVAAIAGAIGLGLPGIRIVQAPSGDPTPGAATPSAPPASGSVPTPSSRPTPSISGPLGFSLGLGDPITLTGAAAAVDFPVALPRVPNGGGPAAAWLLDGRLSFVWPSGPNLPPTAEPGIGVLLSEFRGSLDPGYFEKVVGNGTTLTTVRVGDVTGYWLSGDPHEIVYVDANGNPFFDSRRSVADTLLWARGDVTYRLETGLGRAATIALAETMR